ncbi:hypothetical protein BS78_03G360700 [Paspalum vaginatum]|nr:hypothetical protein BS78_03G360700 [Paspalum vaginatum]
MMVGYHENSSQTVTIATHIQWNTRYSSIRRAYGLLDSMLTARLAGMTILLFPAAMSAHTKTAFMRADNSGSTRPMPIPSPMNKRGGKKNADMDRDLLKTCSTTEAIIAEPGRMTRGSLKEEARRSMPLADGGSCGLDWTCMALVLCFWFSYILAWRP